MKHGNSMVDALITGLLQELPEGLSEGGATRLVVSLANCLSKYTCVDWAQVNNDWPHEWVREGLVTAGVVPDYAMCEWGEE